MDAFFLHEHMDAFFLHEQMDAFSLHKHMDAFPFMNNRSNSNFLQFLDFYLKKWCLPVSTSNINKY
jgi:hypothetical protein